MRPLQLLDRRLALDELCEVDGQIFTELGLRTREVARHPHPVELVLVDLLVQLGLLFL